MTLQQEAPLRAPARPGPDRRAPSAALPLLPVLSLAVLTVVLRLAYLHAPVSSDEGGFLAVARGWHAGGTSLYGDHWVDRPPLLLGVFKLAVLLGGLTPLRVIGGLAAAATVVAVGGAAARAAGRRAGTVAAVVAGALLSSPLLGTIETNGELLAAPLVALAVWAGADSFHAADLRRARRSGLLLGAAAALAVLVKQNMLDGLVFAVVLGLVAGRMRLLPPRLLRASGLGVAAGAGAATTVVMAGAALLGSRPGAVFFAMYPFRVRAAAVMAYVPWSVRSGRILHLAAVFAVSTAPLLLVALLVLLAAGRIDLLAAGRIDRAARPVAVATLAVAAYAAFSVLGGGSYWTHYLVELVVPTALAAGLVLSTTTARPWLRSLPVGLAVLTVLVAGAGWAGGLGRPVPAAGELVGRSIHESAAPGDTIVSLLGDGSLVQASGLPAPYTYLWSLPSRTLDPRLTQLDALMAGPHPPTWVVLRGATTRRYVEQRPVGALLARDYHEVGVVCGRGVYLHDGDPRPPLHHPASCTLPLA